MPTILGANSVSGDYQVSNSIRLEADDSPKLSKTVSTATNNTNLTVSLWYKLGESANMGFISKFADSNNRFHLRIMDDGSLLAFNNVSGTYHYKTTTAKLRDFSAWYHIVFAYDTTDSTAADRLKIYLNGTRLTSFVNNTNPSSNEALKIASDTSNPLKLFCSNNEDSYLSGYVSDLYYIDGQTKAPTDFGKTNENGVWIPKRYGGTFGNNGFKMEFKQTGSSANASGIGADTSGNDHHLTVANLAGTDITTDTPTNNFCTFNRIAFGGGGLTDYTGRLTNGNLVGDTTANSDDYTYLSTFPTNMPFYFEMKFEDVHGSGNDQRAGIVRVEKSSQGGSHAEAHYRRDGNIHSLNAAGNAVATALTSKEVITDNDIIGVAADNTTNNNVKFYHNGSLQGTIDIVSTELYMPFVRLYGDSSTTKVSANFGNPNFSISSGNSDANGYGNFEYAVPSGYYALCTKNLAEYG
tara:strand:- start:1153 stop:2553 length:1401 start_codon:yes stop_codon:yes gene_type:complete